MSKFILLDDVIINFEYITRLKFIEDHPDANNCQSTKPALFIWCNSSNGQPSDILFGDAAIQLWALVRGQSLYLHQTPKNQSQGKD